MLQLHTATARRRTPLPPSFSFIRALRISPRLTHDLFLPANLFPPKQFPQIILPEPRVSINVPPMPKVGPEIKFEGHPAGHVMPHIIPVLPEPLVTIEMPKNGFGKAMAAPQIKTDFTSKKVTLDLSQVSRAVECAREVPGVGRSVGRHSGV